MWPVTVACHLFSGLAKLLFPLDLNHGLLTTSKYIENKHLAPIFLIKPTRCTNFSNLFWNETLHVSHSSSLHHQEFFIVHTAIVHVILVCWQFASRISMFHPDPARKLSANLYDMHYCCVYSEKLWWWTEERSETCRVSFQNKFEKLLHLVGFNKKICHDAWPHEPGVGRRRQHSACNIHFWY
jgi:hypothetical protein